MRLTGSTEKPVSNSLSLPHPQTDVVVQGAAKFVEIHKEAFGAVERERFPNADGRSPMVSLFEQGAPGLQKAEEEDEGPPATAA